MQWLKNLLSKIIVRVHYHLLMVQVSDSGVYTVSELVRGRFDDVMFRTFNELYVGTSDGLIVVDMYPDKGTRAATYYHRERRQLENGKIRRKDRKVYFEGDASSINVDSVLSDIAM